MNYFGNLVADKVMNVSFLHSKAEMLKSTRFIDVFLQVKFLSTFVLVFCSLLILNAIYVIRKKVFQNFGRNYYELRETIYRNQVFFLVNMWSKEKKRVSESEKYTESMITELKNKRDSLYTQYNDCEIELERNLGELNELKQILVTLKDENSKLSSELDEQIENNKLFSDKTNQEKEILEAKIFVKDSEIEKLKEVELSLQNQIKDTENENRKLNNKITELEEEFNIEAKARKNYEQIYNSQLLANKLLAEQLLLKNNSTSVQVSKDETLESSPDDSVSNELGCLFKTDDLEVLDVANETDNKELLSTSEEQLQQSALINSLLVKSYEDRKTAETLFKENLKMKDDIVYLEDLKSDHEKEISEKDKERTALKSENECLQTKISSLQKFYEQQSQEFYGEIEALKHNNKKLNDQLDIKATEPVEVLQVELSSLKENSSKQDIFHREQIRKLDSEKKAQYIELCMLRREVDTVTKEKEYYRERLAKILDCNEEMIRCPLNNDYDTENSRIADSFPEELFVTRKEYNEQYAPEDQEHDTSSSNDNSEGSGSSFDETPPAMPLELMKQFAFLATQNAALSGHNVPFFSETEPKLHLEKNFLAHNVYDKSSNFNDPNTYNASNVYKHSHDSDGGPSASNNFNTYNGPNTYNELSSYENPNTTFNGSSAYKNSNTLYEANALKDPKFCNGSYNTNFDHNAVKTDEDGKLNNANMESFSAYYQNEFNISNGDYYQTQTQFMDNFVPGVNHVEETKISKNQHFHRAKDPKTGTSTDEFTGYSNQRKS